jgi:teichuronic acid exporter
MFEFKINIITGAIWSVFGRLGTLIIVLLTNIWLARLLSPKEFGQVGVIMFFVLLANVLTESGLGSALIRKKEATSKDYSTVFITNLIFSIICFISIVFFAENIANYYGDPLLENLLICAALVLIINAFQIPQNAKLMSDMKFKEYSIYVFISVFVASIIGIYCAYRGFGVWALIVIQLLTASINTLLLWVFEGPFLRIHFSKSSFKELYAFGVNTTLASLLNKGFDNIYQLVLAKYFSIAQTGYYYQAKKLQDVPGGIITMISQGVVFSSLAKLQDDKKYFSYIYKKITLYFTVTLGFVSAHIYLYSESIILFLYSDKWIGAIFYLQLLTIASFFSLHENINKVIFKVFNQTRKILYLEFVKKIIQAFSIFIGIYYLDLYTLLIGFIITNIISYFVNYYYSSKIIGGIDFHELFTQLKVIMVVVLCVAITLLSFSGLGLLGIHKFVFLPFSISIYLFSIHLFAIMNIKQEITLFYNYIKNNL